uniref:Uncharacterized protein n=1 Tax=Medicago truncatula TaxID=3880 RepID=Q2HTL0_MEDTR|nr:hypothetical protein MtrDRAFT_AC150440g1v2 [Medicago truncatula]
MLSFHVFATTLIPNPVTGVHKLVNKLRRKYRIFVIEFDMEHGVVHLPNMFMHDFGDQINFIATLVDSQHNQFEVYVEKHTSGIYLTRGWRALRDFYKLFLGAWVTMVFVGNGRFEISLEDRVGDKIQSAMFTPPMNFVIDRFWLPFQMMDVVPIANVHSDMSFLYSYQKKLSATELDSSWMVGAITFLFALC